MSEDAINDLSSYLDSVDENGVHHAKVQNIRFSSGKDGRNWVIFKFVIADEDNPLAGEEYERWVRDYSHLSRTDFDTLSGEEKKDVRRLNALMLQTLIDVGFTEDEAREIRSNPKSEMRKRVIGNDVWIEIAVTNSSGRVFKNIRKIQQYIPDSDDDSGIPF